MTKNRWKGSMKIIENHIDPGKEERMKHMKTEAKSQARKILKLAKNINPGNKDGNLKKKAELINLIEDFHQQHDSLYSLYEELRLEVKKNINLGDDDSSPDEESSTRISKASKNTAKPSTVETSDFLKDKLTSTSEVKKSNPSENQEILKGFQIQEEEWSEATSKNLARIRDLEKEVENSKHESSTLSKQKRELEEQVECKLNEAMQMKEKISKMETQILEIESKYKENESQFYSLRKQFEVKEHEYLSRISELVTQTNKLQLVVKSSMDQVEVLQQSKMELDEEIEKRMEENKNLKEKVEYHVKDISVTGNDADDVEIREKLCRSEDKVRELEILVEEKEDEMLGLKEEKREAIRQLCLWIDHHRARSDDFKKMLLDINRGRVRAS